MAEAEQEAGDVTNKLITKGDLTNPSFEGKFAFAMAKMPIGKIILSQKDPDITMEFNPDEDMTPIESARIMVMMIQAMACSGHGTISSWHYDFHAYIKEHGLECHFIITEKK
jgi:hypothetical protein